MKKTIYDWILIIAIILTATMSTATADSFMDWHKKVSAYETQYNYELPEDVIKELIDAAKSLVKQGSNDPRFYTRLMNLWAGLEIQYYHEYNSKGKYHGSPEVQMMRDQQQFLIRKALDVDDSPDAVVHLGAGSLVNMVQNSIVAPDIVIRAGRKALDLSIAGEEPPYGGEVGQYEWYLFEFLTGAYAEAQDYEGYLKLVNDMLERYPNRKEELLILKQDAEAVIAAAAQDGYAQTDTYTAPKVAVVQQPIQQAVEPKKARKGVRYRLEVKRFYSGNQG